MTIPTFSAMASLKRCRRQFRPLRTGGHIQPNVTVAGNVAMSQVDVEENFIDESEIEEVVDELDEQDAIDEDEYEDDDLVEA
jgi:hypothetical protein